MQNNCLDFLIYGKKMRKTIEKDYIEIQNKYGLKKIDLDILFYYSINSNSTASRICQDLGFNKGQISTCLDRLCKNDYLASLPLPDDRRCITYSVTKKAQNVIKDIKIRRFDTEKIMFEGITEDEISQMEMTFQKLFKNIEKYYSKNGEGENIE